ncbi:MAG: hypothetical protein HDS14_06510 [Bacteroides sp.]|nr:hypothetical protein [Bacteroides sp.]
MINNRFLTRLSSLIFSRGSRSLKGMALVSLLLGGWFCEARGCTSGLFGASVTRDGRMLLWKHRDTSAIDNKVAFIPSSGGSLAFVGLFNAADRDCREVWGGFNEAGLAVMNTASYNIKDDDVAESKMDREGFVMRQALEHCRTVDDFALLLDSLPRPMGVEANFGVFDASGNGAYFETNNHSYRRYDLKDEEGDWIVRTNYSHGGRPNEGYGFVREANALYLLEPAVATASVSPELLTEGVSRSFYHSSFGRDFLNSGETWAIDQDFIPRYKSSAVIVIEGNVIGEGAEDGSDYVMWTGLGYPPCSEIYPVTCSASGVDPGLQGTGPQGHSPLSDRARKRRDEVFPIHYGNGDKYIRLDRLSNAEGTGYIQTLVPQNLEAYRRYRETHGRRTHERIGKERCIEEGDEKR